MIANQTVICLGTELWITLYTVHFGVIHRFTQHTLLNKIQKLESISRYPQPILILLLIGLNFMK